MIFKSLSLPDLEQVRLWRNDIMASLRTPFLLTEEMQEQFYAEVICNRQANSRFWGIWVSGEIVQTERLGKQWTIEDSVDGTQFIGLTGIENIQWENRIGEIALILNPDSYGMGYGTQAVQMLLDQGFNYLNLENIYGECYLCSPAIDFWYKIAQNMNAMTAMLPNRKYYGGKYYDAFYFNFGRTAP